MHTMCYSIVHDHAIKCIWVHKMLYCHINRVHSRASPECAIFWAEIQFHMRIYYYWSACVLQHAMPLTLSVCPAAAANAPYCHVRVYIKPEWSNQFFSKFYYVLYRNIIAHPFQFPIWQTIFISFIRSQHKMQFALPSPSLQNKKYYSLITSGRYAIFILWIITLYWCPFFHFYS